MKLVLNSLFFFFVASIFIGPAIGIGVIYPLRITAPILFIFFSFLTIKKNRLNTFAQLLFKIFSCSFLVLTLASSLVGYFAIDFIVEINDLLNFLMIFIVLSNFYMMYMYDEINFTKIISKAIVVMYFLCLIIAIFEMVTFKHFSSSRFYNLPVNIPTVFFNNQNDFASIFTLMFLFILTHFKQKLNLVVILFTVLHLGIVFYTGSRLSFLALFIFLVFFRTKSILRWSLVFSLLLYFNKEKLPSYVTDLFKFSQNLTVKKNDNSKNVRLEIYKNGITSVVGSFGLGYGINSSSHYYKSLPNGIGTSNIVDPHSFLIELLINSGVIVFFLFIVLNLYIFYCLVKQKKYEHSLNIFLYNILLFSSSSSFYVWAIYFFLFVYYSWADSRFIKLNYAK